MNESAYILIAFIFVVFLGSVLVSNIAALLVVAMVKWRTRAITRKRPL